MTGSIFYIIPKKRHAKTISLFELMEKYPTEEDAIKYLERLRWGNERHCTRCGSVEKITPQSKHPGRYWCGNCRKYFTARTGTPLEYGKVDLRKWIFAAYLLMTARKGISRMYEHDTVNHSAKEFVKGMASTNGVESVWAVVKRGYNGVYHNWSKKHMRAYINEFAFRLNEGRCAVDTEDRLNALFEAMAGKTITFEKLTS